MVSDFFGNFALRIRNNKFNQFKNNSVMEHNFYEDYNEIMYNERDVIVDFLKKQYDVRYGHQRDTWHFEKPIGMTAHQGSVIQITDIKLDNDKFVVFMEGNVEWECTKFAYGELSKVIEALPQPNEVGRVMILADLLTIQNDYDVKSLLEEYPYPYRRFSDYKIENNKVILRWDNAEFPSFVLMEENNTDELRRFRDHLLVAVLHCSYQYKELMDMLSLMENLKYECENKNITFDIEGSGMIVQVLSVMRSDAGELSMNVKDVATNEVILLQEKEIMPCYLDNISSKIVENAIMDTLNCHNKELVYKINVAWSLSIYQSNFVHILYAIAQRDAKEIKDKFDCIIKTPEEAMANAHMILENVCDDSDLEIILNFIGWKDNVFNEE